MKYLILVLFCGLPLGLWSQNDVETKDKLEVYLDLDLRVHALDTELPFWMYANTFGGIGNGTQGYAGPTSRIEYLLNENSKITSGISAFYRDGVDTKLQRNELYIQYERPVWRIVLGSKNPERSDTDLSTTNENILLSGNTRSLPGVLIETTKPLQLLKKIHMDAGLGHYALNDEQRFVQNTRVHYKRLYVFYNMEGKHSFKAGIQHFAQWGGTSPILGEQPDGLSDFVSIFLARGGGDNSFEGDQVNALGNHLGSIDAFYTYTGDKGILNMYHLHLFDDGSGTRFANFPDGVWGVKYKFKNYKDLILNYEYVDTRNQSGATGRSGRDNYFSNSIYRSGWTYEGDIIGLPFFELNPDTGLGITNNRVVAHHVAGKMLLSPKLKITGKITYLINKGTFALPTLPNQRSLLQYASVDYFTNYGDLNLTAGYDLNNSNRSNNWAIGLGYKYALKKLSLLKK